MPDPYQFPQGIKPVADYVHAKGLLFGICDRPLALCRLSTVCVPLRRLWGLADTDRGSSNCKGVQTGSAGHMEQDATQFAEWGVDFVKVDSCGGQTHGTVWQQ